MLLWGIWRGRCDYNHNKMKRGRYHQIYADWSIPLLKNYHSAREQTKPNPGPSSTMCSRDQLIDNTISPVFIYATYKEDNLEFGVDYAIFDLGGMVRVADGKRLNPLGSVLPAELEAIKLGM